MSNINYHDRYFIGIENYDSGDLTAETTFHYRQQGDVVWGTFEGGGALRGNLVAKVLSDGRLDMLWHYINRENQLVGGKCISVPEVLPDGRIRLHESWSIFGTESHLGRSVIEEIPRSEVMADAKNR